MTSVRPVRSRLPIPAFLAELTGPEYRSRLEFSVRAGPVLVIAFMCWGMMSERIPTDLVSYWPVALKLVTGALAWLAIRKDRLVLPAMSASVLSDVVAMTWAIYMTGGPLSPFFCIYAIELTAMALLSNVGTTILVSVVAVAQYTAMVLLVYYGVLPATLPPVVVPADITGQYLVLHLVLFAFVLAVPTFFTAAILNQLREKQRALEERTQALVDASRERAQFMANVTHELRTPIHGIHGLAELVVCGVYGAVTDDRQKRALNEITASADSMLALVDDLLQLARSDAGRLSYEASDVDMNELCDRLVATTRGLIGTRPLGFAPEIANHLPRVTTDRAKLTQIVLNLLANAVKFTPDEGRITLRARRGEDAASVVVSVEDTGRGIPTSELVRIFEPFHQVEGGTEREHGGVGLGLTLVKRLADLLGAKLTVESELGRGTVFTIVVPVAPALGEETPRSSLVAELA